jgi:hypothetical protein
MTLAGDGGVFVPKLLPAHLSGARIDDQRQRSFLTVTGYPGADRPGFRITKTGEAVCVQAAISEGPSAADVAFLQTITERD